MPTDEDESEPESEEEFELSEKEQRLLHEAYDTYATTGQRQSSSANCRTSFADAGNVRSVVEKLTDLPDSWPLMRILIPLDGLSLQIERIIACVAAELSATHLEAKTLGKFVKRVAKKLTAMLACYLAGEVASTLSPVAAIGHREMVAPMYHPLLTPGFWVRPIYMELLHASSRLRRDTRVETARPSTGLVKILCTPKAQKEGPMNATLHNKGFAHWLGAICHAQSLYVWVLAHWAPCICTVVKNPRLSLWQVPPCNPHPHSTSIPSSSPPLSSPPLRPFFFALCCLGKIPGGAPFSQLHKSGNGSRVDRP